MAEQDTPAVPSETDRLALQAQMLTDKSTVSTSAEDLETFVALRGEVLDLAGKWGRAWNTAGSFALQIAIRLTRVRYLIFKADGTPDIDGTTNAYTQLVENDIREVLDNLGTDEDGNKIIVRNGNQTPIEAFRTRVQQARSDYRVNFAVAAEHLVKADPELAATVVPVLKPVLDDTGNQVVRDGVPESVEVEMTVADIVAENPPGTTSPRSVPPVLVEKVDAFFEPVKDTKGNRKSGFRTQDIPPTFGRQPKPKPQARKPKPETTGSIVGTMGPQDDSSNVVPPDAAMLARWAGNTVLSEVLPVLLRAATAASDAGIGLPGKSPADPNPVLPDADSRKLVADLWEQLGTLAWESGKVVGRRNGASKGNVQPVRWTDPTGANINAIVGQSNVTPDAETPDAETPDAESAETTTEAVLEVLTTPDAA